MQTSGPPSHRIAFSEISSASRLFTDYLQYSPEMEVYFGGDFRHTESFDLVARRTLAKDRDRVELANVLIDQNSAWGLSEATRNNIERLRRNDSVAVVTGQQLGLFLSPLYIPYKTLTTILLARKLEGELNRPVVPVFWLAGEDHDFEEVASFQLLDETRPVKLTYKHDTAAAGRGPVGRLILTDRIEALIQQAADILPQTRNKEELLAELRVHFQAGRTFTDAFASFLSRLFRDTGLVIVNSDSARLKRLCAPLFQLEVESPAALTKRLETTTRQLAEQYHAQVMLKPTNLFFMNDEQRLPIDIGDNGLALRDGSKHFDRATLVELAKTSPHELSPNVILRPITQDLLFPTVAYVGGPGEIAYYAQCKPAYQWAGLPMPVIFPRASMTLIEPAIDAILRRYNWNLLELQNDPEALFRDYAMQRMPFDLDELFANAESQIDDALTPLKKAALSLDKSLERTAGSTRTNLLKDLDRLTSRILRAQKRNLELDRSRIFRAHAHLFPGGKLQERAISPLHFLNLYGLDFFTSLERDVSLDTTSHQVIWL